MDHLASDTASTRGILDALHDDESDYVRLSVAHHLNDISKINPNRAINQPPRAIELSTLASRPPGLVSPSLDSLRFTPSAKLKPPERSWAKVYEP